MMAQTSEGRPAALAPERVMASLDRVNAWLVEHIDCFSPMAERDRERFTRRMQAFGELCLYLHLSELFGVGRQLPDAIATAARTEVMSERFRRMFLGSPARSGQLLMCLLPSDWRDAFPGAVEYCRAVCRPLAAERSPFQLLADIYALDMLGALDAGSAIVERQALALSALRGGLNHLSAADKGPYAFTHSAFYATRFGMRAASLDAAEREAADAYSQIELSRAFNRRDLDIGLEMVLARLCLSGRVTAGDALVVESALSLLEDEGVLRSPENDKPLFADDPKTAAWEASYHTMAVLGLLLMRLAAPASRVRFDIPRDDAPYMERLALAMDALGTLYAAMETGNPALAVYVLSKMHELESDVRPAAALLAPVRRYVEGVAALVRNGCVDPQAVLNMSPSEFQSVMAIYDQTAP